jgi:integrase
MREGELVALTWGDVNLVEAVVAVRRSFTESELTVRRIVARARSMSRLMSLNCSERGRANAASLRTTFSCPGSRSGVFLHDGVIRWNLYEAMERAGVPREGPTGEKRTFHSLRHTVAKRALETGRAIFWLSRHLGHSSVNVTTERYGHCEASERKREAELMEGVFTL